MSEDKKKKYPYEAYGYKGDEDITISAGLFGLFKAALVDAINKGTDMIFPQVVSFQHRETGKKKSKLSTADQKSGMYVTSLDIDETFDDANKTIHYQDYLKQNILPAYSELNKVHMKNVDEGLATDPEELRKYFKEKQEADQRKGQMEIVPDDEDTAPEADKKSE